MSGFWRVEMLGHLRAVRNDTVVTHFGTRKTAALLAYLAYHPDRPHPREVLAELLWPEEDPGATRVRLRTALTTLRQILEDEAAPGTVLVADRSSVILASRSVTTDVACLDEALRQAQGGIPPAEAIPVLTSAVGLYRGELLPGFYEDWIPPARERLRDLYISASTLLVELLVDAGQPDRAIEHARGALAADPLREALHRRLIRLYADTGRRSDALRQYREVERILRLELNASPGEETRRLVREIERSAPAALPENGLVPAAPAPVPPAPAVRAREDGCRAAALLEPAGGAVPLDSPFYVERPADREFQRALLRGDSIVLLKGPRQVGKTSLLARGLEQARAAGIHVVLTDFQKLPAEQLRTTGTLFLALAEAIAEELELDVPVRELWNPERAWSVNFERFLRREVLQKLGGPLVWGLDEVDRLFAFPFAGEVFGLFRSWHNERALRPSAPWQQLTLAIAYATEAHLFITDLHQSPFNVGTRLELEDFHLEQVADLNGRCDSPLKSPREVGRLFGLVGGHPFLVRCGLYGLVAGRLSLDELEARAPLSSGPFGDHLRRLLHSLNQDPDLRAAARQALEQGTCPDEATFYRLRSAGVVLGDSAEAVRPRCRLYSLYLEAHLG